MTGMSPASTFFKGGHDEIWRLTIHNMKMFSTKVLFLCRQLSKLIRKSCYIKNLLDGWVEVGWVIIWKIKMDYNFCNIIAKLGGKIWQISYYTSRSTDGLEYGRLKWITIFVPSSVNAQYLMYHF